MKTLFRSRKEKGVGLIEILIVLVVLVIAWAAIAALQGKLMSGSATSKARSEARELAREKTEDMRSSIEKGQYVADLAVTGDALTPDPLGSWDGVNATFTRSWKLVDVDVNADGTTEDYLKQLVMKVAWTNNQGVVEDVVLNSLIVFSDKLKIASLATGGSDYVGKLAHPNQLTGDEGPAQPGTVITGGPDPDEDGGNSNPNDDIYTGTDDQDNLVVYGTAPLADNVLLTVFGGKILKFSGMIYYDSSAPYVRATSPSYCTTFTQQQQDCGIDNSSSTECAKYVCYVGGDCSNGGDGCPPPDLDNPLPDLNGGWYGKIGDFFPSLSNPQQFPTICMGDSTDIPARLYYTKRVFPESTTGYSREGINTSFECHDTLISAPNDSDCEGLVAELNGYGIFVDPNAVPSEVADHEIIRPMATDGTNTVLAATNNNFNNGVFPNYCGGN